MRWSRSLFVSFENFVYQVSALDNGCYWSEKGLSFGHLWPELA